MVLAVSFPFRRITSPGLSFLRICPDPQNEPDGRGAFIKEKTRLAVPNADNRSGFPERGVYVAVCKPD